MAGTPRGARHRDRGADARPGSAGAEAGLRDHVRAAGRAGYTPADLPGLAATPSGSGLPGEYPFTRGVYPTMYRGRLWTMRMFAGFGRPEDTNRRFKFLLEQGQTGLSTAFDMPSPHGVRRRPPAGARRGRPRGRVGLDARRHGAALRGHPARAGHHVDDHQLHRVRDPRDVPGGGGAAGRAVDRGGRHDPERHAEGVQRAEGVDLPAGAGRADRRGHDRVLHELGPQVPSGVHLGLPHPRGGGDGGPGARLHAGRRHRVRRGLRRARTARGPLRARSSRSSSTSTRTSSRRSRSSARPGACGPRS